MDLVLIDQITLTLQSLEEQWVFLLKNMVQDIVRRGYA